MFSKTLLASLVGLAAAAPSPAERYVPTYFNNATIFTPPASWSNHATSYARSTFLQHGGARGNPLLTTWSFSPPGRVYAPIYESLDYGQTWNEKSQVFFSAAPTAGSAIFQTDMYELPHPLGKYPAGTVLIAANAIPADFSSTNIQLYASMDRGSTWEFLSTVAQGGPPNTTNGATPVWEPKILMHEGEVGVFYSDQRDPLHGQKLAHQTSTDLLNWGPVVNDAAEGNYTLRPGMTTIAKMGNNKFIFSYEMANAQEDPVKAPYAVHYRIADSPFEFNDAEEMLLKATDGTISSADPQTIWTPAGGPNGTVITLDGTYDQFFINHQYGAPDAWEFVPSGHGVGYTRNMLIVPNTNSEMVLVTNGGMYGEKNTIVSTGDYMVPSA